MSNVGTQVRTVLHLFAAFASVQNTSCQVGFFESCTVMNVVYSGCTEYNEEKKFGSAFIFENRGEVMLVINYEIRFDHFLRKIQCSRVISSFGVHCEVFFTENEYFPRQMTNITKISLGEIFTMNFQACKLGQGCQRVRPMIFFLFLLWEVLGSTERSKKSVSASQTKARFFCDDMQDVAQKRTVGQSERRCRVSIQQALRYVLFWVLTVMQSQCQIKHDCGALSFCRW